jgi:hypothetical protein
MTNEEFKCWISGYLMLTDDLVLDKKQIRIIKNHANLVQAVMGSTEESICNFISYLDTAIENKSHIPISEVKRFVWEWEIVSMSDRLD